MRIAFAGDSLTTGRPGSSYFAILRERLAGQTLVNLGRGNDTVISLHRRLTRLRFGKPFDIAFLWIGVNDVTRGSPRMFQVVSRLARKPPAKNLDEFRVYYQMTLDLLCRHAWRIIAVPPLLKGENLASPWNCEIETQARVIEELASAYQQVEYLDVRPAFRAKLNGKRISDYLPKNVIQVAFDILMLKSNSQIDNKAAERGLHVTLDGIHLNSIGAKLVAETFLQVI